MVFRIFAALTRARELIRGPVFGHFHEKCERLVILFCEFLLDLLLSRILQLLSLVILFLLHLLM